jgi:hypothetical protein
MRRIPTVARAIAGASPRSRAIAIARRSVRHEGRA